MLKAFGVIMFYDKYSKISILNMITISKLINKKEHASVSC